MALTRSLYQQWQANGAIVMLRCVGGPLDGQLRRCVDGVVRYSEDGSIYKREWQRGGSVWRWLQTSAQGGGQQ